VKNLILALVVLTIGSISSFAQAETTNYLCNNGDSEFQVDTTASKVTFKNHGYFGNFIITSPILLTSTSAQWQMKNKLDLTCAYTASVKFYKSTGLDLECATGIKAEVLFSGKCPDGSGSQTFYCCAR